MAIVAISMIACKKEEDSESPIITIISPTENMTFEDSISINFKIEDMDLHEAGFTIVKKGTTDTLYDLPMDHTHESTFLINEKLKIAVTSHLSATLTVNAADHNENKSTKSVDFNIHPM